MKSAYFVLVPGAYRGAWLWERLTPHLLALGHGVEAICPIGVGERAGEGAFVTLSDQVGDVLEAMRRAPAPSVLVGHSLAGLHVAMAASRAPDRVAALIFLDALFPEDGDSFQTLFCDHVGGREAWDAYAASAVRDARGSWGDHNGAVLHELGAPELNDFVARLTPQPMLTLTEPVRLPSDWRRALRLAYVACARTHLTLAQDHAARAAAFGAPIFEFPSGHDPMWTRPADLAAILVEAAG